MLLSITSIKPEQPLLLASVADIHEAALAIQGGADVIDIKDARHGSLGAAALSDCLAIVAALKDKAILSCTTGDLPMQPDLITQAYATRVRLGVSYVKMGLTPCAARADCLTALAAQSHDAQKVAVLFADLEMPDAALLEQLTSAGFAGVVIDTFSKQHALLQHVQGWQQSNALAALQRVVDAAQDCGLFIGLAGSLVMDDVALLAALRPTLLGFRGALCRRQQRTAALELAKVQAVRHAMDVASAAFTTRQVAFA